MTLTTENVAPPTAEVRVEQLRAALEREIQGEVRFDQISRALYSTDASVYQIMPLGVVIPKSRADVITTMRICRENGASITARGGGTSQAGQAIGAGVQLDFSKYMNRVIQFSPDQRSVRVQPGIVLDELNALLKLYGLHLPLDLSTSNRATIGGMIANNSAGTRSVVYGKTIDYVSELTAVLADGSVVKMGPLQEGDLARKCEQQNLEGDCYRVVRRLADEHAEEIRRRYPKILRRVGGYNLDEFVDFEQPNGTNPTHGPHSNESAGHRSPATTDFQLAPRASAHKSFNLAKLIVGSEGTLALVLEAKLQLTTLPPVRVVCVVQFQDLLEALSATPHILKYRPSAVELLDRFILDTTRGKAKFEPLRDFIVGDPAAALIVEFFGDSADELVDRIDELEKELRERGLGDVTHRAAEADAQDRIWQLRRAALGLSMSQRGDAKAISFVEDTAVAPHRLRDYIERFRAILREHHMQAGFYAHASVGLLHIRPVVDMKTADGVEKFRSVAEQISQLVLEFGGALSGEHGDGLLRSPFQERMFGPLLYQAFCQIKQTFDRGQLLNPGKIVHARPITDHLRFGPSYVTRHIDTAYDFSDFGGISRAAEQCAGVGACRKARGGTMCPSFMATREEKDSTRGRANALRLAISGQLGEEGLTDEQLYPVLDLCLECKACKTECPTEVDMARLKSEFLYQYYGKNGIPRRARLLAHVDQLATYGSRLAPVSNWIVQSPVARWLNERLFGLDHRRRVPRFARRTFLQWWRHHATLSPRSPGDEWTRIAVFADTFSNYHEPQHAMALVRFAQSIGAEVTVPPRVCCGRPLISKGLLSEARRQAEATTRILMPLAEGGTPIVFCEPSCFSAVRDDHAQLLRGDLQRQAKTVAAACLTFEEWAADALSRSPAGIQLRGGPNEVLLHGHCHQKSLVGMHSTVRLLSAISNCTITEIDSGCCGMAGSFGYERDHYEVSRLVGERKLFPAIREMGRDTVVVAAGFSCRHQIKQFTGVDSVSTATLLDSLIMKK